MKPVITIKDWKNLLVGSVKADFLKLCEDVPAFRFEELPATPDEVANAIIDWRGGIFSVTALRNLVNSVYNVYLKEREPDNDAFYSFETSSINVCDGLYHYFKRECINYELSSCEEGYHFSLKLKDSQVEEVNNWLSELGLPTLTEVK